MGKLFKASSGTNTTTQSSDPWQPTQDSLKSILSEMNDYYDSAKNTGYISSTGDLGSVYQNYLNGLSGISNQASTGTTNLLNQSTTAGDTALNGYTNAANGGLNYTTSDIANSASNLYNSDLVQNQIDAANRQIDNTLNENTLTGIDKNAVSTGNMGSSRAGVAQAVAQREAAQLKADNANTITGNAYNSAVNTAANTLSNNATTQLNGLSGTSALSNSLANQANNYSGTLTNSLSPTLTSSQLNQSITAANQADQIGNRDYLANLITQYTLPTTATIAGLGKSNTNTTQTAGTSTFDKALSAGSAVSSIFSAFSDKRLKKNIKYLGKKGEHNIYSWDWNDKGKELAGDTPSVGVIAQEVMQYMPEAVSKVNGYYKVDYGMLNKGTKHE